jgi:hypothetical protein
MGESEPADPGVEVEMPLDFLGEAGGSLFFFRSCGGGILRTSLTHTCNGQRSNQRDGAQ